MNSKMMQAMGKRGHLVKRRTSYPPMLYLCIGKLLHLSDNGGKKKCPNRSAKNPTEPSFVI